MKSERKKEDKIREIIEEAKKEKNDFLLGDEDDGEMRRTSLVYDVRIGVMEMYGMGASKKVLHTIERKEIPLLELKFLVENIEEITKKQIDLSGIVEEEEWAESEKEFKEETEG